MPPKILHIAVMEDQTAALKRAVSVAGSRRKLAQSLGISFQAVCQWKRVPIERVAAVEKITGVPRAMLRPDIFGELPK